MNFVRRAFLAAALVSTVGSLAAQEISPPKGVADFRSLHELLEVVPKHVLAQLKTPKDAGSARMTANAAFADKALHKWVTLKVRVKKWEPFEAPGVVPIKYRVEAEEESANASGVIIPVQTWVNLGADAEPIVTNLAHGEDLTVTAFLNRVEITDTPGGELKLNLELARTKVKPKQP
jgi:hypothetical protein